MQISYNLLSRAKQQTIYIFEGLCQIVSCDDIQLSARVTSLKFYATSDENKFVIHQINNYL